MSYGVKATVENELNMNSNNTVGLPTQIGALTSGVYLGNVHNVLLYNTIVDSQPVTLYTSDGFLVKVNNVNVTKFNSNEVDFFTSIDAKQNYIYNVPQPIHPYDVCMKGYADGLAQKCHLGLIPSLSRNTDKSGYVVTASSEHASTYSAFKAFRAGNTEWTTNGVTSNFWIKIKCLQAVRVWKFVLTGRRNDS